VYESWEKMTFEMLIRYYWKSIYFISFFDILSDETNE